MHLLHNGQWSQLICFFIFIFFVQISSIPIKDNIKHVLCNPSNSKCALKASDSSTSDLLLSYESSPNSKTQTAKVNQQRSTTSLIPTTKSSSSDDFDNFSDNLKRAALILAGIALGLGILRICLMLCKSKSQNNSVSNRHSAVVRPQISTIEHHQFKPDMPPAYAEAISTLERDGGKLPTYEELPAEQRLTYSERNHDGVSPAQL